MNDGQRLRYIIETAQSMSDRLVSSHRFQDDPELRGLAEDVAWLARALATLAEIAGDDLHLVGHPGMIAPWR
jgi:hypothetical protein